MDDLLARHQKPHRRYNPLQDTWVLVSPQRASRPWQGGREAVDAAPQGPSYDASCYLCPGNLRANGARNPRYDSTFVFMNDFAAVLPLPPEPTPSLHPLLQSQPVRGEARVICFSPRHDLTLARMPLPAIRQVIDLWQAQAQELGARYSWVQIFENRGAVMGASNPHPHGQIWATDRLPSIPSREDQQQRAYHEQRGRILLLDYARLEQEKGLRLVLENETWLALLPYWAVWPYEILLLPKMHLPRLQGMSPRVAEGLAGILKSLLVRYDNLFEADFPYSMGWHGAPNTAGTAAYWQLHAHFYPPLLRSASIKKFMVGYEMLAEAQRDISPEQAAARLRELPDEHYSQKSPPAYH